MKKRFYCLLAAVLMAGACICVPVAEVKAEDGYNIDSYDNDDWYDSDDSPTDMVLDLSNVTIDKTSQPKRMQEKFYDCSSLVWKSYHKNGVNFGMAYYAPVAADMGKWCVQYKKLVSGGLSQANIQNMKLNQRRVRRSDCHNRRTYRRPAQPNDTGRKNMSDGDALWIQKSIKG